MGIPAQVPCTAAFELRYGRVRRLEIPQSGLQLTSGADYSLPLAQSGTTDSLFEGWTLRQAASIVSRVTPWVRCVFAPDFVTVDGVDGIQERYWGARCYRTRDIILVTIPHGSSGILSITAHECWHALEEILTPAEIDIVDAATTGGLDYADDEYYASAIERRARAFQYYAMCAVETGRLPGGTACERLFRAAYEGRLGLRGLRWLSESLYPAEVRELLVDRRGRWLAAVGDAVADAVASIGRAAARFLAFHAWAIGLT